MLAGDKRKALLAAANQLSVELGYATAEEPPGACSHIGGEGALAGILDNEDEMLVMSMRRALARVAAALDGPEDVLESAVSAALDGAELVMRGELVRGNASHLPALMPSFVFLVALPVVDQDRALELSRRSAQLVEKALG